MLRRSAAAALYSLYLINPVQVDQHHVAAQFHSDHHLAREADTTTARAVYEQTMAQEACYMHG